MVTHTGNYEMKKQEILHIYTRVSTGIQEEEGTSLDTQLEEGIKRSKKLDMGYKHWNVILPKINTQ
jgi:hypothetical protein